MLTSKVEVKKGTLIETKEGFKIKSEGETDFRYASSRMVNKWIHRKTLCFTIGQAVVGKYFFKKRIAYRVVTDKKWCLSREILSRLKGVDILKEYESILAKRKTKKFWEHKLLGIG